MQTEPSFSASQMQGSFDGVGKIVGDNVGLGDGDGVGDGVGDCVVGEGVVGDGVVGDGDGDGVGDGVGGVFGPVHVTGGLHGPVLRHAGHIAPLVHVGLEERSQPPVILSLMAHMPTPAPVNLLPSNFKVASFVSRPSSVGTVPLIRLLYQSGSLLKSKLVSSLRRPSSTGRVPLILLPLSLTCVRAVRLPISLGIVPTIWLWYKTRPLQFGGSATQLIHWSQFSKGVLSALWWEQSVASTLEHTIAMARSAARASSGAQSIAEEERAP